jgi:hypothetical protein
VKPSKLLMLNLKEHLVKSYSVSSFFFISTIGSGLGIYYLGGYGYLAPFLASFLGSFFSYLGSYLTSFFGGGTFFGG